MTARAEDVPLFDYLPPPKLANTPRAVVSLFTGIGGFDLAFQRAGYTPVLHAEADAAPRAVLEERFPGVPDAGDVRLLKGEPGAVHVLCAGSPCQDFSVAGLRAGLEGLRSGLAWEFVRLVQEYQPTWFVWENVPGVLSSHGGRDFATIIGALGERGYGCAWRVLDAQCLGVPQRRRRVFVVGHRSDVCRAGQVLLEPDRGDRDSAARSQAGAGAAWAVEGGPGEHRRDITFGFTPIGALTASNAYGMDTERAKSGQIVGLLSIPLGVNAASAGVAGTLGALTGGFRSTDLDGVGAYVVQAIGGDIAHTLTCEGHDGTEDGTGRGTPIVALAPAGSDQAVPSGIKVRRLTPLECERIQGFPDDWTRVRSLTDTARYRMIGNAVAVPVVEWIARGIADADRELAAAGRG